MIASGLVVLVVLTLFIVACVLGHTILQMVCVIGWTLVGFILWNMSWPEGNTYLPVAASALAGVMSIVSLVIVVNHYLGLRTGPPTHDSIQADYRKKVLDVTRRKEPREW